MNTNEYPPRHIPGFRPLVPGEAWHRTDWAPDMLPEGWRPRLKGELAEPSTHEVLKENRTWGQNFYRFDRDCASYCRTRRPLPPPPPTFEYYGNTWKSHVPGDPCPVDGPIELVFSDLSVAGFINARILDWGADEVCTYPKIGYRIPDAEPQDDTAKLRERIAELENALTESDDEGTKALLKISQLEQQLATWETELSAVMPPDFKSWHQNAKSEWPTITCMVIESLRRSEAKAWEQLATALTPRPIAEAGPVKEGFVRLYGADCRLRWVFDTTKEDTDTHYLDIRLPEPDPRAEYERAVAEAGGAFEAWLQAKGGVK